MINYIKFNTMSGKLTSIESASLPIAEQYNEIIYHPSQIKNYDSKQFQEIYIDKLQKHTRRVGAFPIIELSQAIEFFRRSILYVEEKEMGIYGKGLFLRIPAKKYKLILPYVGLYIPDNVYNSALKRSEIEESRFSTIFSSDGYMDTFACVVNKNLCLAHSAQHFSMKKENDSLALTANLEPKIIFLKAKFNEKTICLPLQYLTNCADMESGSQLGWDYGMPYWIALKSGFLKWNADMQIIDKIAFITTAYHNGKYLSYFISQKQGNVFCFTDKIESYCSYSFERQSPYTVLLPKDSRPKLFNANTMDTIHAPVIFIANELVKNIDGFDFIVLPRKYFSLQNAGFIKNDICKVYNGNLCLSLIKLEALTTFQLSKLIIKLNINEITGKNFLLLKKNDDPITNREISDQLDNLFEILDLTDARKQRECSFNRIAPKSP